MCKYCKNIGSGDDYNPISTVDVEFGFAGNLILDLVMQRKANGTPILAVCGCMDCKDNEFQIETEIKFCPICGQQFKED